MKTLVSNNSWEIGATPETLDSICHSDVNIVVYERDISALAKEIESLIKQEIEVRVSGDITTILNTLKEALGSQEYNLIIQDIKELLYRFKEISTAKGLKLFFATVDTNMCRKFHADLNYLRMLCTYSGAGTLWLSEDNVHRQPLDSYGNMECTVIDENRIQQAQTGSVVILKGALYLPKNVQAVVHRSPTIEENNGKRLLLRIDTNEFLSSES